MKKIKKIQSFIFATLLSAIPFCTNVMLVLSANSVDSPINGQPIPPKGLKSFRRF